MQRWLTILALLAAGCVPPKQPPGDSPLDPRVPPQIEPSPAPVQEAPVPTLSENPKDPPPNVAIIFRLECYSLKVPFGSISRNEDFWKRMNEQCVNAEIYRRIFLNGMRVGTAPFSEWEYISNIIKQNPGAGQTLATVGSEMKNLELPMKKGIVFQNIFAFETNNELIGRTYDRCVNVLSLSYQKAPRTLAEVRLTVAPLVRSAVKRYQYTDLGNELEITYDKPVSYYLGLTVDIPVDSFLVISPSSDAQISTSLGRAFLIEDGPAEQFETVMVVLARPFRADDPAGK